MRSIVVGTIAVTTLTAGCLSLSDSQSGVEGESTETSNLEECKIEGSQIGREGVALQLGATRVTFHDWIAKPDSEGEYVGFSISIDGDPYEHFLVKAGTKKYIVDSTSWMHPDGARAHAISNVDFCECTPPGGGGGGGGDGDGENHDDGGGGPIL